MFFVLSVALWLTLAGQVMEIPLTTAKDFYRQGMSLIRTRKYEDALMFFTRALDKQPDYAEAYCGRGQAYNGLGLFDRASAAFSKAIEIKSDYAEAYTGRGGACLNLNPNAEKCMRDLDQAVKLDPKFAEAYILRGMFYRQTGNPQRARTEFDQAIKLQPRNADALFARATVLIKLGNKSAAVDDLKRVVEFGSREMANAAKRSLQQMGVR